MTLLNEIRFRTIAAYQDGITWTSPAEPQGMDWSEVYIGLTPIPSEHPPSLRNPKRTPIPTAQDGWRPGDSKAARDQAMQDLVEIHKRLRRQIGKPEVAQVGQMPGYPQLTDWV